MNGPHVLEEPLGAACKAWGKLLALKLFASGVLSCMNVTVLIYLFRSEATLSVICGLEVCLAQPLTRGAIL